ncbi:hypothetical protein GLOIN_2v1482034 [Rhizophagus irregularis DAOM 181602=DAOM 197198]|uniref:Uncharacterized protein n=1 Tax=Rhizophagus irregularis (strain DAOM 181602 / DAOM 197198 / MUCL 43194) TaxID=747089 RepID=A0A2P4PN47_RHIID|nr:hypothetical protein GLOIN_2v1482034 [Rhizophagus irregularis DAOM 181602=DAOM 197198]POG66815.1 hypothetical protein GLOIN_2v1482034 [Rhizophagus irregularis DAOM 181602=DAOM 197198]GET59407.1 hypothetical protein GLOIN_2v1482034 [Rhizophagus irregularis DAOM 181602=DAOM 197198]|eukprot:XP_025173681.1 hypothetical protein GLOIN_2v1482034 [Rhizophagus irregularis DAOM 181602=DAOM 197198]
MNKMQSIWAPKRVNVQCYNSSGIVILSLILVKIVVLLQFQFTWNCDQTCSKEINAPVIKFRSSILTREQKISQTNDQREEDPEAGPGQQLREGKGEDEKRERGRTKKGKGEEQKKGRGRTKKRKGKNEKKEGEK